MIWTIDSWKHDRAETVCQLSENHSVYCRNRQIFMFYRLQKNHFCILKKAEKKDVFISECSALFNSSFTPPHTRCVMEITPLSHAIRFVDWWAEFAQFTVKIKLPLATTVKVGSYRNNTRLFSSFLSAGVISSSWKWSLTENAAPPAPTLSISS